MGSRGSWWMALVLLVLVAVGTACSGAGMLGSGSDDSGDGATGGGRDMSAAQYATEASGSRLTTQSGGGRSSGAPEEMQGSAAQLPALGPSVIKTATLELGVDEDSVDDALQEATQVAGRYGGYVSSTTIDSGRATRGTVVVRIPSTDFERALSDLEGLGEVDERSVSGQDVSQQFVDLEARLRNWRAQEAILLDLMERATSVTDTIRVQGELSRVQLEIERLRGRLDYLEDQTSLGTITATFTSAPAGAPAPPSTLARAWERALEAALSTISAVIVALGFVIPPALLAAVVLAVFRALRPRLMS